MNRGRVRGGGGYRGGARGRGGLGRGGFASRDGGPPEVVLGYSNFPGPRISKSHASFRNGNIRPRSGG
jgi:hypothetical protein